MFDLRATLSRPVGGVRLVMADYDTSDPSKWRTHFIPWDKVIKITPEDGRWWSKWLTRMARKFGRFGKALALIALAGSFRGQHNLGAEHMPLIMGAISSAVATSFKSELGTGTHNFTTTTGATVKTALYTSSATLGASTTAYSATNEISGTGYTATGTTMANVTPTTSGTTAIYDWADAQWTTATFTANGSLTYNSSVSNKAIFVIAFGSDQTVTAGTFTIQWPAADASNAIIRY